VGTDPFGIFIIVLELPSANDIHLPFEFIHRFFTLLWLIEWKATAAALIESKWSPV